MIPIQPVRVAAKALIIVDGRLLCIHKRDEQGDYDSLPSGGQELGEPLLNAVRRECREELNADVRVVRDYIGRNHAFAASDGHRHALDVIFECALASDAIPHGGPAPDDGQLGVAWLEIARLRASRFYPAALADALAVGRDDAPIYLGDVN